MLRLTRVDTLRRVHSVGFLVERLMSFIVSFFTVYLIYHFRLVFLENLTSEIF